jgi:hypothetical protein
MKTDGNLKQTYSNNFGNTHLGVGPKGIDGFILNIIFKPFVTRLIMMKEYLMSSENVALYGECRAFLTCIKENHGGIFRLVVFSSLLDPEKKLKVLQQQEINMKMKTKASHVFVRQDATTGTGGKGVRCHIETVSSTGHRRRHDCFQISNNRDASDDVDNDRTMIGHGQALQTMITDETLSTTMIVSTSSMKLKGERRQDTSPTGHRHSSACTF